MKKTFLIIALIFANSSYAQVGINTSEPLTELDVNGKTTIRETPILIDNNNLNALYVDDKGLVGIKDFSNGVLTEEIFYAFTSLQRNTTATEDFNNNVTQYFEFETGDILYNTIGVSLVTIGDNKYFKVAEDGVYEFNGFLNFRLTGVLNNKIFIAIKLEYSEDEGTTWVNLTGSRPVYTIDWSAGQTIPYTFPTTIYNMKKNSLLRIAFYRTKAGSQQQGEPVNDIYFTNGYGSSTYKFILKKL